MDLEKLVSLVIDIKFDTGLTIFTVLMSYLLFRGKHHSEDKTILSTIIILILFLLFSLISWICNLFPVPLYLEGYRNILTSKELKVILTSIIQFSLVWYVPKYFCSFIDKKITEINTHNIFYHIGYCKSKLVYVRVHLTNGDVLQCCNVSKLHNKTPTPHFSIDNNGNVLMYLDKIKKNGEPEYKEYKNPQNVSRSRKLYYVTSIPNSQISYMETGFLEN